jgi:hypothetical protein
LPVVPSFAVNVILRTSEEDSLTMAGSVTPATSLLEKIVSHSSYGCGVVLLLYFCFVASLPFRATLKDPSVKVHWLAAAAVEVSTNTRAAAGRRNFMIE